MGRGRKGDSGGKGVSSRVAWRSTNEVQREVRTNERTKRSSPIPCLLACLLVSRPVRYRYMYMYMHINRGTWIYDFFCVARRATTVSLQAAITLSPAGGTCNECTNSQTHTLCTCTPCTCTVHESVLACCSLCARYLVHVHVSRLSLLPERREMRQRKRRTHSNSNTNKRTATQTLNKPRPTQTPKRTPSSRTQTHTSSNTEDAEHRNTEHRHKH